MFLTHIFFLLLIWIYMIKLICEYLIAKKYLTHITIYVYISYDIINKLTSQIRTANFCLFSNPNRPQQREQRTRQQDWFIQVPRLWYRNYGGHTYTCIYTYLSTRTATPCHLKVYFWFIISILYAYLPINSLGSIWYPSYQKPFLYCKYYSEINKSFTLLVDWNCFMYS